MAPSPFTNLNGTTNARGEFAQLQRHHPYYINGGDIHFLVENYVFRVHRYFFERESSYFRDKLTVPATPGRAPQGTEDANAIVLDVRAQDFEKLMWVFYNPKYSIYETGVPEWSTILQLAHRWSFPEVKALVVRELEKMEMTAIDRIVLYQKYECDENLLVTRFAAVCAREEPITVEEGERLGIKTAMKLTLARERLRSSDGSKSPLPAHRNDEDVRNIVINLFDIASLDALITPAIAAEMQAMVSPPAQQAQPATIPSVPFPAQTTTPQVQPVTLVQPTTNNNVQSTMNSSYAPEPPFKGPTPKSSLAPIKANTKSMDHKSTPSINETKPSPEQFGRPNGEREGSPLTPAKDTPNGHTDLGNVSSPLNPNSPANTKSHRSENSVGSTLMDGGATDVESDAGGPGAKMKKKKTKGSLI